MAERRMADRTRPSRVVVLQTTIPDYRSRFFTDLSRRLESSLVLLSGNEDWESGVEPAGDVPHLGVHNTFFARRKLLWQSGAAQHLITADVAVIPLNPRNVTSWLALVARRLRGKRTLIWGHAWPRRGRTSKTDYVRGIMRRLANTLIVYTETEARELAAAHPHVDVVSAANALYRKRELTPAITTKPPGDLVCVARLTPAKKPGLLLDAFLLALQSLPADTRLVFVGDGQLRAELTAQSEHARVEDRVVFAGHRSTLEGLRAVYAHAVASVSPGYAGLSLIQSLGFGVPMIIARDADHAPEIEAAIEGDNAVYFSPNSPEALASAIVAVVEDRRYWVSRRADIAESVKSRYTIDAMVESFVNALEPRSSRGVVEGRGTSARRRPVPGGPSS